MSHIHFELFCTNARKATVNETLMEIRKITKAFKAYALFFHSVAEESTKKSNAKKCFGRKAEVKDPQEADEVQINMFGSRKPNAKLMKCFNYSTNGHGAKEYQKLKNECPDCWSLEEVP